MKQGQVKFIKGIIHIERTQKIFKKLKFRTPR